MTDPVAADPVVVDAVLPAYGRRSLAEVLPALLAAIGVPGDAAEPGLEVGPARAVALLLVDGLGSHLLRQHAADAPFLAGLPDLGPLTVGFPSSTSISLSSLGTGLPPGAHGMLGISFRAGPDDLLDTLRWTSAGLEPVDLRERFPPEEIQSRPTLFERAETAGVGVTVVSKAEFGGSGLTRAALRGGRFQGTSALGDLAAEMVAALSGPGRQLCYGYHSELDALGHLRGPGSLAWRFQLGQVDRLAEMIADRIPPDAVLVVTGDHGMVGVDQVFDADTHPELRAGVRMLGGDPRARHVYVRDGAQDDVLAAWLAVLGDGAWVVPAEQAVADGWFGPVARLVRDRIGDVVAAARATTAIVRTEMEPMISQMPGQHGSLTGAEQLVPLLVARA